MLRLRTLEMGDSIVSEVFSRIPAKRPPEKARQGEVSGEAKLGGGLLRAGEPTEARDK